MADFTQALVIVLRNEGGYVAPDKAAAQGDPGGETYRGIARGRWPKWPGWEKIDAAKQLPNFPDALQNDVNLYNDVSTFYSQNFWQFSAIKDQQLATKIFDMEVNMGKKAGVTILQHVFRRHYNLSTVVDGVWGATTEAMVNRLMPMVLLNYLRAGMALHYADIGIARPAEWAANKEGWMNRAVQ